ncbi:hypothetical protein KC340_g699 [Hortaea werneckii]|nr:hypothetical protein KC342_g357 [Hortaea werneckii]KAI7108269.1 hypothetical protein KC339_g1722 [Hortaea werneckii]KAI7339215.1 hypothetical protein KC340_g699 [Hortaea werneckii]KAI7366486.1 hypothetical protein KC354_g4116 [Hortaea werneckii]KAI7481402.1 hypothetical protein KC357_g3768 [Hortaea werneckii]
MADSVDRVFGHALNTVNKIRPGSQKPPAADRLALYGLYKQSMEGDVATLSPRPSAATSPSMSTDALKKEQEKWDAWKSNEGLSRTEAKRRYIEKLISTMHEYASGTDEAKELVEELEFVWDQIKSNSNHSSSSERSSPLQNLERSGYISSSGNGNNMVSSSAAAMEQTRKEESRGLTVLSPVSQVDEEEGVDEDREFEEEEFVDAPVSQVDIQDFGEHASDQRVIGGNDSGEVQPRPRIPEADTRWKKRVESSLIRLTTEVAALREQLESRRFFSRQRRNSFWGWVLRLGWWAVQLIVADAVILWLVILYMRRKNDRKLEGAIRVLLGDAVAQVQKVGREVKIPQLPKMSKVAARRSNG